MSPFLFDADLARTDLGRRVRSTTTVADALDDLFGDDFSRALWRETKYEVPMSERLTCPIHQDWRDACFDLHIPKAA